LPDSNTSTSVADRLLTAVLRDGARSVVVAGTAKNAGKTVTLNALRTAAFARGMLGGVTSIGRDGEAIDAVSGAPKPAVRLEPGTVVALPRALVPVSPAMEILELGEESALGPIVFARVRVAMTCEIGGPPTARALRATITRLAALSGGMVFVDGAIDRIAPLAGGDDAIVLATGAVLADTVEAVAAATGETVRRLTLRGRDPAHERATVDILSGALDARVAQMLLAGTGDRTVVVADPTRIAIRGSLFDRVCAHVDLRCERPLRLIACTTSGFSLERSFDPQELVTAVARATGLPAYDLVAQLVA
jgi:hypothetical protein